jgi:hypothetical protein
MKSFSTPPVAFSVAFINEGSGVLQKVVVAQAGKVKSYFEEIDSETLSQIVSLGNAKENGIKARFGHPNMCSSAFGTYIGRFKNFQLDGEKVTGDLHLDTVCKNAPGGNLYDYILTMAKKNPDMFGASMAFIPAEPALGAGEFPLVRIEELLATDLVDDPAATNSLFAVDSFSYQATQFLDENPAIAAFIARRPETIIEFLLKYFSKTDLMKPEIFQKFKNLFASAPAAAPDETAEKNFNQAIELLEAEYSVQMTALEENHRRQITELETAQTTAFDALQAQLATAESEAKVFQTQISDLTSQVASLKDQLNANPTKVTSGDPQVTVGHPEVKFGKELLAEMPSYLKDKLKK